ncbi:MAG: 2-hydroxychromene-2-carboxylate isomerase [Rhodospirillales bacterium]|nr:2-hydroxychromene-2-carboxylate isomerase [Rhodospirillales bacterium]
MSDSLDFYFDFSSPYGYLAAERIDGIAAKHRRSVTWRPMLLGAVFQKIGGSPLVNQPMKGPYSQHDMLRSARLHGITFNVPDNFPVNSIAACRAYYWLADSDAAMARDFAQALYRGYFVENRDLSQPETVVAAAQALGVDGHALVAAVQDQAIKDRLRAVNDAALDRGVFGSPTVFVGGEMFWGHDRLEMIDRWLETGGW